MTKNKKDFAILSAALTLVLGSHGFAGSKANQRDVLIKVKPGYMQSFLQEASNLGNNAKTEALDESWIHARLPESTLHSLASAEGVEYVQPNYKIRLLENYRLQDSLQRAALLKYAKTHPQMQMMAAADNPAIPNAPTAKVGADPLFAQQWGMNDIGTKSAWNVTLGDPNMIVAVIDTGVDYTHEDLLPNMWRNPGETGLDANGKDKATNGIDDDSNGFVDDVVGWDFVSNDNKPFDLAVDPIQLLIGGGNPGHGTHCAGNVAARGNNSMGIAGVAPNVKIMAMRFLSEKGEGTTAEAIKSINYAVKMGAKVLSNSWGSIGEDPNEKELNQALRDTITAAQNQGALFIAAAGNGKNGAGYNNDTDTEPAYPASYENENIVSVAALDVKDQLGSFSNWGFKTVDIGAPGVDIFSTMVGNKYSNKVIDYGGITVTWDGTSMATPHVAGAAALYWSANPTKTWREVKEALLTSAKKIPALSGKVSSEGKLNVSALMKK